MNNADTELLKECARRLGVSYREDSSNTIELDFSNLSDLHWKGKPFSVDQISSLFQKSLPFEVNPPLVRLLPSNQTSLLSFCRTLLKIERLLKEENLRSPKWWKTPQTVFPTGFNEKEESESKALLQELYSEEFVVSEKKPFLIDLENSFDAYMISAESEPKSIIDSAAQIASLGVGFNGSEKTAMHHRSEVFDPNLDIENWDVHQAYRHFLQKECPLPHVHFVNSGAEAVETALRGCQTRYPKRRNVIAFEGSFHGRTLLSLHATYNPAKRAPFEICPERIQFATFPEDKTPHEDKAEPQNWIEFWSKFDTETRFPDEWLKDPLLSKECQTLLEIGKSISDQTVLAVVVEPMQCEGGDRYATPRFFRALRILTRAMDTPLVFDEVQTGFGLGSTFFWYQSFSLVDFNGDPDLPDAISLAKKAQVGICLSRFDQEIPIETSAASLYRGYLHALAIQDFDPTPLETQVSKRLTQLQDKVGPETILHPRNRGLCFAFDLPNPEMMAQLVAARFRNGTLFYPAGEKTLRFRLMATTTETEIDQIFSTLYQCFTDLAESNQISSVPPYEEWLKEIQSRKIPKGISYEVPWKEEWIPKNREEYVSLNPQQWQSVFLTVIKNAPDALHFPSNKDFGIEALSVITPLKLWERYESDPEFSLLELLWHSSRAFGHSIKKLTHEQVGHLRPKIQRLEEAVYEPERQDDPEMFYRVTESPKSIFLASLTDSGELIGICAAAPLQEFKHIPLVDSDPLVGDENALYSIDLTILPEYQGQGLGLRLKIEQILEAKLRGIKTIRSRNRYPEAKPMARLNQKLSAVVINEDPKSYGGKGTAQYQSLSFCSKPPLLESILPYRGALKNKTSLANFVSPNYIRNLLFIKKTLPPQLRHLYLTSGKAECVDKAIRLLRIKRPKANKALSFEGDYFGKTTAAARSLGGPSQSRYFDEWPVLKATDRIDEVEKQISKFSSEEILGFFVEPLGEVSKKKKDENFLSALIDCCREKDIPVIFNESASKLFQYDSDFFFCASKPNIQPDLLSFYATGQLGVVLTNSKYFLEKPLMMISTWDGDEHSLNLFRDEVIDKIEARDLG